jgi:hypothetical protein
VQAALGAEGVQSTDDLRLLDEARCCNELL